MLSPLALPELHSILSSRVCIFSVTGGIMASIAVAMFRGSLGHLLLMETRSSESLMNFASQGTLRCICGESLPKGMAGDRRQFCRACGCEIVPPNSQLLDKHLSPQEIRAMTASVRKAAIRAGRLDLPPTITTIEELNAYLVSTTPKISRIGNTTPVSPARHSRVH